MTHPSKLFDTNEPLYAQAYILDEWTTIGTELCAAHAIAMTRNDIVNHILEFAENNNHPAARAILRGYVPTIAELARQGRESGEIHKIREGLRISSDAIATEVFVLTSLLFHVFKIHASYQSGHQAYWHMKSKTARVGGSKND